MNVLITKKLLEKKILVLDDKWLGTDEFVLNTKIANISSRNYIPRPRMDSEKSFQKLHAQSATWTIKAHISPFRYRDVRILETTTLGCVLVDKSLLNLFSNFSQQEFVTNHEWVKILQRGQTLGFVKCAPFLLKKGKKSYDFWSDFHRFKLNA